ncbi:MFS general substrate transporter [Dothidotthia symphoricarpi CBS 119687]|uniref:MFS general substrate transporter n=1 Tax=Dothidotthia symphoricarpi CBS 119687 TaxID=1392245 RepID=A0A6A5ZZJ8_9PLEO|nr:MFS general substrate transporter [Dothidotthia symphoricarpi CBS 119687]KAF2125172.1 MFS general substrate transporter [Dothidotthia symphoricarpi CBS 119687]
MAQKHTPQLELASYPQPNSSALDIEPFQNDPSIASEHDEGFSLPPTDGGKDAWLFLFACFMLEALIWGFPASYGIFQEYYTHNEPFAGSNNIAVVGTCAMGIMYMALIPVFVLLKFFPKFRAWATPVGLVIICLALGLGSFSNNITHLILTQGIVYAIGGSLAWTPILFYIEEWWVRRRGLAFGVTMAGFGMSGAILPVVLEWLLHGYGFRTTLRVCSLMFVALNFPILFFFKPRLPLSQASQSRSFDMSFWTCSNYLILQSGNIIQSLGFFLPAIYLPTFARSIGANNIQSTVTVILLNAAACIGNLCMGMAVDKYHVVNCLFVTSIGSAIGVFLLWGFSTSLAPLYVFCVIYGAFAGSQASTWSAIVRGTKEKRRGADSGMVFACLSAGKGVGNLCSGPLSVALLHAGDWHAKFAYGSGYGALIAFTGATALLSGWSYAAKRIGWL